MTREAPALGWALALIEETAATLGGRWPKNAADRELVPILALLRLLGSVFKKVGKRRPEMKEAIRRLSEALASSQSLLAQAAHDLHKVHQQLEGSLVEAIELVEALTPPRPE